MGRPGVMVYFDLIPSLRRLTLEKKGLLFDAIFLYASTGTPPAFEGVLGIAWDFIQPRIDADNETYQQKCDKAKQSADSRWGKKHDADECERIQTDAVDANSTTTQYISTTSHLKSDSNSPHTHADRDFTAPSIETVKAYCLEAGLTIDASKFVDYYSAIGWAIGSKPVKDWKALQELGSYRPRQKTGPDSAKPSSGCYQTATRKARRSRPEGQG